MLLGAGPLPSRRRLRGWRCTREIAFASAVLGAMWVPVRAGAEQEGLSIETGSPDALCPELESTRAAVRRRLGELVVPNGAGFVARYTIGHAPAGSPRDFVRLQLRGSDGLPLLERDLPLEGESCSTMAEVIALVLDRYFRALLAREPGAGEVPAAAVRPGEAPASAAPPSAPEPLASAPDAEAPQQDSAPSAESPAFPEELAVGQRLDQIALELAFHRPQRPALGVRATFELWPQLYAGTALHLTLVGDRETLPEGGQVTGHDAVWRAYAGWGPRLGTARSYLGPGLRLNLTRGVGRGLADEGAGMRASWALGLDAGVLWALPGAWLLHVSGALDWSRASWGGRFYVAGNEVLEAETLRVWLGIGAGYDL